MKSWVWLNRSAFLLLMLAVVVLAIAFTFQPRVSDDFYVLWKFQRTPGTVPWLIREYREITGRGWIILLTTFVSPYPLVQTIYRAFIVVEVAFLGALAWYCALGRGAWQGAARNLQALAMFGILLWFALPARNETVAWLIGNFAYLVPALFGLAFIAWQERASATIEDVGSPHMAVGVVALLLGVCAGVAHEQVVAACVTYLALVIFPFSRRFLLGRRDLGSHVWFGLIGLLVGAVILVSAPSNYARMNSSVAPSIKEMVERMVLYLSGAYFDLGTETVGKYIWFGLLVLGLLFFNPNRSRQALKTGIKRAVFWGMISIVTLLAMAPASTFISTRTTMFAVIFLYIAVASAVCRASRAPGGRDAFDDNTTDRQSAAHFALRACVLMILSVLVLVEGAAALISNASVFNEVARRDEIVRQALSSTNDKSPILIPFMATQPAALTYIQNPQHDCDFLYNWSIEVGRQIKHDVSDGAPLPNSVSPLKAIKFRRPD